MKTLILPLLVIIFLLFLIRGLVFSIISKAQHQNITPNLEIEYENKKKEHAYLKEKLQYVKSREFIEEEARNKLGLVQEGDYIILGPPLTTHSSEEIILDEEPNWKQWYSLFF